MRISRGSSQAQPPKFVTGAPKLRKSENPTAISFEQSLAKRERQIFNQAALGSIILQERKARQRESLSQKKTIRTQKAPTSGLFCLAVHNIFRSQDRIRVNNSN